MAPEVHPHEGKRVLRQRLRALRASISEDGRRHSSTALCRLALRHRLIARGRRIGFYLPAKGEIDPLPLLNRALWIRVAAFLPEVPARRQRKLWFNRLGKHPRWQVNRYGITEYADHRARRVRISALDLVFIPLLGFDRRGYRLGMGGGFYDASLGYLARRRVWKRPLLIGVAFAVQEVERIPEDAWDIPLDGVLTEQEFLRFR